MRRILLGIVALIFVAQTAAWGGWTVLNYPGAAGTDAMAIDGARVVGHYYLPQNRFSHGFLYDGTTWTALDYPGAKATAIYGIDGLNLVGSYEDSSEKWHGFLYDGTTWTTIDYPGAAGTGLTAISGTRIIGYCYFDNAYPCNFLYDGTSIARLDAYPGNARGPFWNAWGTDGTNIIGFYEGNWLVAHGLLYDGSTWTQIDFPEAYDTYAYGIEGRNIVGAYDTEDGWHGFLYDGTTWTTLSYQACATYARGISGGRIVGLFAGPEGDRGFIYSPDVPASDTSQLRRHIDKQPAKSRAKKPNVEQRSPTVKKLETGQTPTVQKDDAKPAEEVKADPKTPASGSVTFLAPEPDEPSPQQELKRQSVDDSESVADSPLSRQSVDDSPAKTRTRMPSVASRPPVLWKPAGSQTGGDVYYSTGAIFTCVSPKEPATCEDFLRYLASQSSGGSSQDLSKRKPIAEGPAVSLPLPPDSFWSSFLPLLP